MQKKEIKRRKPNNKSSDKKSSSSSNSSKNIKKRVSKNKKMDTNLKIAIVLACIAILLTSYLILGIELTIIVGIMLVIIGGIAWLLKRAGNKTKQRKIINIILIIGLIIGIICLIAFSVFLVYVKTQADPKFETVKLNTAELTRIFDKDGNEIAKLGSEKREKVTYDKLPEVLVDAIIATEDSRFFQHNGFDAPRFLKATVGQVLGNSSAGGASTLSMQVVKNSFTDKYGQKTSGLAGITRKFEDIYLAVFKLEKKYSKEQIIEYYVNNHFLGGNIYGVEEASKAYFGKSVTDLNLSEAAILAGMFKSPN